MRGGRELAWEDGGGKSGSVESWEDGETRVQDGERPNAPSSLFHDQFSRLHGGESYEVSLGPSRPRVR